MPWRGPEFDGDFPSLGWQILEWGESHLRVPDGPRAGQPLVLTDEQASILVRFYGLDDRGKFLFRRGAVRRAQGWGKSPLLAFIAAAELVGPARFAGWSSTGEPVAREVDAPWIQIAAVSEDQTDNTYGALYAMLTESDLAGTVLDVGLTRIHLRGGPGKLEAVTSSAGTRLGQRITFAVLDEPHLWTSRNGGKKLAATIRRNAAKMGGRTFETTNAHAPGEDTVAEATWKAAQQGAPGLLYDSVEAPPLDDLGDRPAVVAALTVAYGDSADSAGGWVPVERLADEIADPATDPDDARRFYLNQLVSAGASFVDVMAWAELASPDVIPDGTRIGLGFDGSISDDMTALYGCTAEGLVFEVAAWERPDGVTDWRVPRSEVHDAVAECFARYDVGRMLCDPPKWHSEIETWAYDHGADVVLHFPTNSARRFAPACDRFATAVREGAVTHDGRPDLGLHLAACARKKVRAADLDDDHRSGFVIVKADTRKIDRAVAAVLALEAAATMPAVEPAGQVAIW